MLISNFFFPLSFAAAAAAAGLPKSDLPDLPFAILLPVAIDALPTLLSVWIIYLDDPRFSLIGRPDVCADETGDDGSSASDSVRRAGWPEEIITIIIYSPTIISIISNLTLLTIF